MPTPPTRNHMRHVMSKHNRERKQFRKLARENIRQTGLPGLTAYQLIRIGKHGKRKLAGGTS